MQTRQNRSRQEIESSIDYRRIWKKLRKSEIENPPAKPKKKKQTTDK